MTDTVPCAACQRPMHYVHTAAGRTMPLDPEPVEVQDDRANWHRGLFVYAPEGHVRSARPEDPGPFFRSHFATCPEADRFRRTRRSA